MKVKPKTPLDWKKILEHIEPERRAEVKKIIERDYSDVVTTNWPVVQDPPGGENKPHGLRVIRFKLDPMTRWLVDVALSGTNGRLSINDMVVACQSGSFGKWDRRRIEDFYRGMGYSLCGFGEVFRSGRTNWRTL